MFMSKIKNWRNEILDTAHRPFGGVNSYLGVMTSDIHHWKALTLRNPEWYGTKYVTPGKLEKFWIKQR